MTNAPIIDKAASGMREILSAFSSSESRYFDEERYSESEIRKSLNDSLTEKKIDAMKRLLAAVSLGRDASGLFPDVVKNVSFQSLELKRLIYIYLVQYAESNRDLALLAINSFQKDLSDRSQLVRASALRAMASIKVLEVIQLVMVAVKTASHDSSPYVRKACAQCITKVYSVDPDQFYELRALLLKLMSDGEVIVVSSAVMSFHQICVLQPPRIAEDSPSDGTDAAGGAATKDAGGEKAGAGFKTPDAVVQMQLVLLHPYFKRLCQDALLMDAWAQQSCIDLLIRYCRLFFASPDKPAELNADASESSLTQDAPEISEDFRSFLKTLKLLLTSASQGVILAAVQGLCYLAPRDELAAAARPVLRTLRQAPAESAEALLAAVVPMVDAQPDMFRPSIREFLVQSFDYPRMKEQKIKLVVKLVDETNVQLVLRELRTYVTWQSQPKFVALAVQAIAQVALKVSSVADACLRGLVNMLDSKCEALSCEAVVSLRALLQQRQKNSDSGLGSVLPHLVRYLDDLSAPSARASVVWIIGQYQHEVAQLAPDVVRKLAKSFAIERQEVKQQVLGLSLKVWAFHALNAKGKAAELIPGNATSGGEADAKQGARQVLTPAESTALLPRLEAMVDYIISVASYDTAWDVRDMARAITKLKASAKEGLQEEGASSTAASLVGLSLKYCCSCVGGAQLVETGAIAAATECAPSTSPSGLNCTWLLGSMAQALDFPLDTYRPLPNWAAENTSDELRKVKAEPPPTQATPKFISSDNVGNSQHMEKRVQNPSNITNLPQVSNLADIDLFYSDEQPSKPAIRSNIGGPTVGGVAAAKAAAPAPTLDQIALTAPPVPPGPPRGTAVFGEDDESSEEDESDDGGDDWKYCQAAASTSGNNNAPTFAPPARDAVAAAPESAAVPMEVPLSAPAVSVAAEIPSAPAESTLVASVPPPEDMPAPAKEAAPTAVPQVGSTDSADLPDLL